VRFPILPLYPIPTHLSRSHHLHSTGDSTTRAGARSRPRPGPCSRQSPGTQTGLCQAALQLSPPSTLQFAAHSATAQAGLRKVWALPLLPTIPLWCHWAAPGMVHSKEEVSGRNGGFQTRNVTQIHVRHKCRRAPGCVMSSSSFGRFDVVQPV
jgi:hypothetical protein